MPNQESDRIREILDSCVRSGGIEIVAEWLRKEVQDSSEDVPESLNRTPRKKNAAS